MYKWLIEDVLNAEVRYRFYSQTKADDYEERFVSEEKFRTQDSDLGEFDSHSLGLRFNWVLSDSLELDFGGTFVKRSDGLDQILGIVGFRKQY